MGVSSGDRGGQFKGLNARVYFHLFDDNLCTYLFNDAVGILRVYSGEYVRMIRER